MNIDVRPPSSTTPSIVPSPTPPESEDILTKIYRFAKEAFSFIYSGTNKILGIQKTDIQPADSLLRNNFQSVVEIATRALATLVAEKPLKSQMKTLSSIDTTLKLIDTDIVALNRIQDKINTIHTADDLDGGKFQKMLNGIRTKILKQFMQFKVHLNALKETIEKSFAENKTSPLDARKQEMAYKLIEDRVAFLHKNLSKKFQDTFMELPQKSSFETINRVTKALSFIVDPKDEDSPYTETINNLDALYKDLGEKARMPYPQMRPENSHEYYMNLAAPHIELIEETATKLLQNQQGIEPKPGLSSFQTSNKSLTDKQRLTWNQVQEIYTSEASYVSSLDRMITRLEIMSPGSISHDETHQLYLLYVRGLSAGGHLMMNRFETFFQTNRLTEENLEATLEQFFNELAADPDFKNYLRLYIPSEFMFERFKSYVTESMKLQENSEKIPSENRWASLSVMPVQRVMRYALLFDPLKRTLNVDAAVSLVKDAADKAGK